MSDQGEMLKAAIAVTQPFAFYATDIDFHVSREFNPSLNRDPLALEVENSLVTEYVKYELAKTDAVNFDLVRFFTSHKASVALKPKEDGGSGATSSPVATFQMVMAAEYRLLDPNTDDSVLVALADHCALVHAYPYAREIIQSHFLRAGFLSIALPYLGRTLTGKVSGKEANSDSQVGNDDK